MAKQANSLLMTSVPDCDVDQRRTQQPLRLGRRQPDQKAALAAVEVDQRQFEEMLASMYTGMALRVPKGEVPPTR